MSGRSLIEDRLPRVKRGDYVSARLMLSLLLHEFKAKGGAAEPALTEWFVRGVSAFLNGEFESLDEALGLKRKHGWRKWENEAFRNQHVRGLVELYIETHPTVNLDRSTSGLSVFEAVANWYAEVTRKEPLSADTIKAIWYAKDEKF